MPGDKIKKILVNNSWCKLFFRTYLTNYDFKRGWGQNGPFQKVPTVNNTYATKTACIKKKSRLTFCIFSSSQKQYTVALLDRYRKALETAVQLSCRYNVPPLPGRTVIMLSNNMRTDFEWCKKQDFCLPPDPEQKKDEEEEEEEDDDDDDRRKKKKKKKPEDKLIPSVRA